MSQTPRRPSPRIEGSDPRPEVDEELDFHLEQRIREYEAGGMSPDSARAAALERLGDLAAVRAECIDQLARKRRQERRLHWLRFSWLDFKLGFRMLARYPGLTVIGSLAMAFGVWVGACTFEMSRQWLRPGLRLDDDDRIVGIQLRNTATGEPVRRVTQDFLAWRTQLESVTELSAFSMSQATLVTEGFAPEPVEVAEITASGFGVTRVAVVPSILLPKVEPSLLELPANLLEDRLVSWCAFSRPGTEESSSRPEPCPHPGVPQTKRRIASPT